MPKHIPHVGETRQKSMNQLITNCRILLFEGPQTYESQCGNTTHTILIETQDPNNNKIEIQSNTHNTRRNTRVHDFLEAWKLNFQK